MTLNFLGVDPSLRWWKSFAKLNKVALRLRLLIFYFYLKENKCGNSLLKLS